MELRIASAGELNMTPRLVTRSSVMPRMWNPARETRILSAGSGWGIRESPWRSRLAECVVVRKAMNRDLR